MSDELTTVEKTMREVKKIARNKDSDPAIRMPALAKLMGDDALKRMVSDHAVDSEEDES